MVQSRSPGPSPAPGRRCAAPRCRWRPPPRAARRQYSATARSKRSIGGPLRQEVRAQHLDDRVDVVLGDRLAAVGNHASPSTSNVGSTCSRISARSCSTRQPLGVRRRCCSGSPGRTSGRRTSRMNSSTSHSWRRRQDRRSGRRARRCDSASVSVIISSCSFSPGRMPTISRAAVRGRSPRPRR